MFSVFDSIESNCCGCGSCESICPKNAITMKEDACGFQYPFIDQSLCIDCGLCKKVCFFQNKTEYSLDKSAYAAATMQDDILLNSSSGGVFATLAQNVIVNGGYVAGAIYDNQFNVVHTLTNKLDDIKKIQGSKYVQSTIGSVYKETKRILDEGVVVLFSGTPCQIDGLLGFLQKDYENLITVDIVCHGVPSNRFFKDYLRSIKDEFGEIRSVSFRDKKQGWGKNGLIETETKTKIINSGNSEYYYLFNKNASFREACYTCKYSSLKRPADLTLGDYWGIEINDFNLLKNSKLDVKMGISLIITNSKKGDLFLEHNKDSLHIYKTAVNRVVKGNHNLNQPSAKSALTSVFKDKYEKSYSLVSEYLTNNMKKESIKINIKRLIPLDLKIYLKRILKK